MFVNKKIAIAVTGGIAAYKTCEVIRDLKKSGAEVRVALTESARQFVTELTFAALSENPVLTSLFDSHQAGTIAHVDLARWCDAFVVCPATANLIGKVAGGLADDLVSTSIMASASPVIFCPAMNSRMWTNPLVQKNVLRLREVGYHFIEPEWGTLATASEGEGWGRLAAKGRIIRQIKHVLLGSRELAGKRVLVTAGPTRESIDPVRYLTNYSSGKMGFALAEAAVQRGAEVTLIAGPNDLQAPERIRYVAVTTSEEMRAAINREYANTDILIMAAAVSDYTPKTPLPHKLRKSSDKFVLELEKTTDILLELGKKKQSRIHLGFALETDNGVANATKKLHAKNLDLIVLNNPLAPGAGFKADTNLVTIIANDGSVVELPKMAKLDIARILLEKVCEMMRNKHRQAAAV